MPPLGRLTHGTCLCPLMSIVSVRNSVQTKFANGEFAHRENCTKTLHVCQYWQYLPTRVTVQKLVTYLLSQSRVQLVSCN